MRSPIPEIALGFIAGILAGADKLTRIAHLRGDPLLPEVLEIKRMASQSTLSRFFGGFDGAATNLRSFRALWHYALQRLPSRRGGYTLDLDSTSLVYEDGKPGAGRQRFLRGSLALAPRSAPVALHRLSDSRRSRHYK